MAELIKDKIRQSLQATDDLYYRLVLLVGISGSGKTRVLFDVAEDLGTEVINLNLAVSSALLDLTAKQRMLKVKEILETITTMAQSPVLLDNIEILFDQNLKQDPLRLLQSISRNRRVVATWNGTSSGGKLTYAETGHPEYRHYDSVDALIVCMDKESTLDKPNHIIGES